MHTIHKGSKNLSRPISIHSLKLMEMSKSLDAYQFSSHLVNKLLNRFFGAQSNREIDLKTPLYSFLFCSALIKLLFKIKYKDHDYTDNEYNIINQNINFLEKSIEPVIMI